ncbi:DUF3592 domain-containing protein [Halogeometricum borinquense]|uniref:DUF3592 domain-containing protein n=1 Tax=Halogeometricum borinquense TaxID=60847 RepID=A0A482SXN5_9EURY|nr:DUF3592 domain-containing protein [Halogeometricum borinquense]RYJ08258.1 DUF3592 domain-containing protein [Halogeometricum borinquense]
MTSRSTLYISLAVAALLFLGGGGYVGFQVHQANTAATTTGTIHSASVAETQTIGSRPYQNYRTNVTYSYTVQDHRYTGHTVFPGDYAGFAVPKSIANAANQYHPGQSVTVYYRPSNPPNSYLIPRYAFIPGFVAMMVAPFILASVVTPGFEWFGIVREVLSGSGTESTYSPGDSSVRSQSNEETGRWNDPASLTETSSSQGAAGDATSFKVTGWLEWVVWGGATAIALAVVGLYLLLSTTQYNQTAYLGGVVAIILPLARAAVKYQLA